MNKKEFAIYIKDRIMEEWNTDVLAETDKSSYIYLYKLINDYTEDEIVEAARWLITWSQPRNIAALWTSMGRWKWEHDRKEKTKAWEYA